MSFEKDKNLKENITTDNIFDELSSDIDNSSFNNFDLKEERLNKYSKISRFVFSLLLIWFILSSFYIFVQKSSNNFSFLSPVCSFISWVESESWECFWVYKNLEDNQRTLDTTMLSQASKASSVLSKAYSLDSFIKSREVVFLLERWEFRLKPFEIIEKFDKEKNSFLSLNKRLIQCNNVVINSDMVMDIDCEVYSSSWNKWDNNTKQWSSVSIASSFQRHFQNSDNFTLLDPQKRFDVVNITWWVFTQMTPLHLRLKYSNSNSINIK